MFAAESSLGTVGVSQGSVHPRLDCEMGLDTSHANLGWVGIGGYMRGQRTGSGEGRNRPQAEKT